MNHPDFNLQNFLLYLNIFICCWSGHMIVSSQLRRGRAVFKNTWWWRFWRIFSSIKRSLCFVSRREPLALWHYNRPAPLTECALTQEHLGGDECVVAEPHRFTGPGPPWGENRGGAKVERRRGARRYGWVERKWKVRKYLNGQSGISK